MVCGYGKWFMVVLTKLHITSCLIEYYTQLDLF